MEAAEILWAKLRKASGKKADEIKPAEKATGQQLTAQLEDYEKATYYYKVSFRDENAFWGYDITYNEAMKSLGAAENLQITGWLLVWWAKM